MILISCSKENTYKIKNINGIKTYINKNSPSDSTFKIILDSIPGFSHYEMNNIADVTMDDDKNIFALDWKKCKVFKFDSLGKFQFSMGRAGNGPGEIQYSFKIFLLNDTLYINDVESKKFVEFNKNNGEFLKIVYNPRFSYKEDFKRISKNKLIKNKNEINDVNNKMTSTNSLEILNQDFSLFSTIKEEKVIEIKRAEVFANNIVCTFNRWQKEKELFLYKNSYDKYEIEVLNLEGILKYRIKKYHKKIPYTFAKKGLSKAFDTPYKFSVLDLIVDKNGYLWSINNLTDHKDDFNTDLVVDIFKNGVFINNQKLPIKEATDPINIYNQSYIYADRFINRSMKHGLRVYKYSYKKNSNISKK